jgi:RNA polymerase sigma-70 factor, ECF subfamily
VALPSTHVSLLCDLREDGRRDEAWVKFHARYRDVILGWCLRRGLLPDRAEDLTQDVLLKLFQQLPHYHHDPERGQFRSWLKSVVNNALTDFWRRQQRRPEGDAVGGTAFLEQTIDLAAPDAAGELSEVIEGRARSTAAEILERVRARLKETTWQAFHRTMVEERPAAEVASELNLSIATVYKAIYRVKQMLLEEYRDVDPTGSGSDGVPESREVGEAPV